MGCKDGPVGVWAEQFTAQSRQATWYFSHVGVSRFLLAGLVAGMATASAASCGAPSAFACDSSAQCGSGGVCQANGYCSFVSTDCPSGQVYGEHAPSIFAGECVAMVLEADTTSDGGSTDSVSTPSGASFGSGGSGSDGSSGAGETLAVTADESSSGQPDASSTGGDDASSEAGSSGSAIQRIEDDLLVLYRFTAGTGDVVEDLSQTMPPMTLTLQYEDGSPAWVDDGLVFTGAGGALVEGSSTKVREGIMASNEMTLEVWTTPTVLEQTGPPRLMTLSIDTSLRSVSLVHGGGTPAAKGEALSSGDQYGIRMQTSALLNENGLPTFTTDSVVMLEPTHVVATRAADGMLTLWVNGEAEASEQREGDFSTWPDDHSLSIGNEVGLGRGYEGTMHLAAVYDRALSQSEILQNYDAGY
ncbi:MAG: LamG domain-containing protein [Nannocystaceae bacterium]|nr:LamG domain-containing protein [Nannocystaceae bacterium]